MFFSYDRPTYKKHIFIIEITSIQKIESAYLQIFAFSLQGSGASIQGKTDAQDNFVRLITKEKFDAEGHSLDDPKTCTIVCPNGYCTVNVPDCSYVSSPYCCATVCCINGARCCNNGNSCC